MIKKRLQQLGWTQRDLARMMDVAPSTVHYWAKGKGIHPHQLVRLPKVLGIPKKRLIEFFEKGIDND